MQARFAKLVSVDSEVPVAKFDLQKLCGLANSVRADENSNNGFLIRDSKNHCWNNPVGFQSLGLEDRFPFQSPGCVCKHFHPNLWELFQSSLKKPW